MWCGVSCLSPSPPRQGLSVKFLVMVVFITLFQEAYAGGLSLYNLRLLLIAQLSERESSRHSGQRESSEVFLPRSEPVILARVVIAIDF